MNSDFLFIKILPSKISFLRFILEGYDHLAILTVIESKEGLAKLNFFKNEKELIMEILKDLKSLFCIEFIKGSNKV